ncbi:putative AAA+ superfamily ATPase [Pedobacter sp. UYP24]
MAKRLKAEGIESLYLDMENPNDQNKLQDAFSYLSLYEDRHVVEQVFQAKSSHLDLFFYRTQAGAECDLLLVQGITPIACIEIKLSNAPVISKGFLNCIDDLIPKFSFIITPQSDTYDVSHDITIINLSNFVNEKLSSL